MNNTANIIIISFELLCLSIAIYKIYDGYKIDRRNVNNKIIKDIIL